MARSDTRRASGSRLRPLRTGLAALTAALLLPLGAGVAAAAPLPGPTPGAAERKIEPSLRAQLDGSEKAVFWVYLDSAADLTSAAGKQTRTAKAETVLRLKKDHAARSQAEVIKALDGVRAEYTSYWIVNAVRVVGTEKLAGALAQRPEVARIDADDKVDLPKPAEGKREKASADAVEWNIDRIKAPQVWDELGVRGEGIVVANIDSGVDYTHPAVANQYRGKNADGTYDHNYSWFDPAGVCPTAAPCDNNDHGTHTMGTMVGDDGGANKIGVAPGAKWIAAKGCESNSCSEASLLAAGQWIVAPTDLNGQNPRPDLAPHVVNNSWGGTGGDTWYQQIVDTWRAAGIFPAFSNGNSGPGCATSGSPGDYDSSYSSGAFDINGAIASFSSRGAGPGGIIKPNIAAPGVNVRSSVPGGYESFSGTSMASPHTAAAVALLWSAAPALEGDIAQTTALLDGTALDTDSSQCGGTAADNNVFGEGKLDVLAAVNAAPRGAIGALAGTVRSGGQPVAGVKVVADGPIDRTTTTAADGTYGFASLSVGDYALTASKFGYGQQSATASVTEDATATGDIDLVQADSGKLTGTVSSAAGPVAGAAVSIADTPVTATTDAQGRFEVTLPHGTYDVNATHSSRCLTGGTAKVTVAGDTTVAVNLPERTDTYGYACATSNGSPYQPGDRQLALTGDNTTERVDLPFPLPLYGKTYGQAWIGTNGTISLGGNNTGDINGDIPSTATPNAALYPFWDDLVVGAADSGSGVFTAVTGTAPHRSYVIEWREVSHWSAQSDTFSFSASIGEDGTVRYSYKGTGGTGIKAGSTATVGVENATGTDAYKYSFNTPVITDGLSIAFRTTRSGVVAGRVLDANDGNGVAGATVTVGTGATAVSATTAADGGYVVQSPSGARELALTAAQYEPAAATVDVKAADVTQVTRSLRTGKVTPSKPAVEIVLPPGQKRTRTLDLTNPGLGTAFTAAEEAAWLTVTPGTGNLPTGGKAPLSLSVDTTGLAPGTVLTADLKITSASGRTPVLTVPVKLVVPRYQVALDAGSTGASTDSLGDGWSPDRKYTTGSYGYQGNGSSQSTSRTIAGTEDQKLFRNAREGMYEYRFDAVPNGTYTVELGFAELSSTKPNKRVFDVLAEGAQVLPSLDIALEAGTYTALTRTYTVTVTDGTLNIRFVTHTGFGKPLLNSLRVTDRPDKS
ncbi:S8 family serine peptidase [Streptomyces sp. NBC_01264]|uniref:S8 family serine peptidase n=1 Tax=Streptomyces sp. NBC_01264 TaxID=2903804 RepID=UPI00224EE074|nr:S8 family serine peptidase [Streptomyces sp. NBC_01264]MCX4782269.1 S8 family serine peptidase [Streptomyces sp. NBC_01264]